MAIKLRTPLPNSTDCDDRLLAMHQKNLDRLINRIMQAKESVIKEVAAQIFGNASPENVSQLTIKAQPCIEMVKDFDLSVMNDEYVYHNEVFVGTISYPNIEGRLNIMFTPNEKLKAGIHENS